MPLTIPRSPGLRVASVRKTAAFRSPAASGTTLRLAASAGASAISFPFASSLILVLVR